MNGRRGTETLSPDRSWAIVPYSMPITDVVTTLSTDVERGLRNDQVVECRGRYGLNQLVEAPPVPLWRKLAGQFNDLVIWILIVAAIISGVVGEWPDTIAIIAIVVLNGLLGFFQEERAEQALVALQKLSAPLAKVIRDGALQSLPAIELLPGDLIELEAGDNIPADARLVRAFGLRVQEAALTGESVSVEKDASVILAAETPLGDRGNMVFMSTIAAAGKATAVVTDTGMNTELGKIAGLLQRYEREPTPLQRRLEELGKILIVVCLVIAGIIFGLELLRGGNLLQVLLIAVSLAVAAVPEGLPAVVTLSLAIGLQRMVKRNALIRKLPSVETLGAVTVICSDKTGTLTQNEMTVREIVADGEHYQVTGAGYTPRGQFLTSGQAAGSAVVEPQQIVGLFQALLTGTRCNNARVTPQGNSSENWQVIGDPTEGALVVAALKAGIEANNVKNQATYEIPFDSERRMMSVVARDPRGRLMMYSKGAPEVILTKCTSEFSAGRIEPLSEFRHKVIVQSVAEMSSRALRVLALAYRDVSKGVALVYEERDLVFAGLVGMIDPPRDEVREAVQKCHDAGVRPVMITGDHPSTALAIARELQIAAEGDRVVTGQDLNAMTDDQLAAQVERISVYARVSAEHKLRVVRAWKRRNQVVAMTGDGVNDAPAVKAADVGIAMGVSGTDVTKQASAMILMDDNFASIVNAIEEGRGIYDNIQKFLHYLLAGNIGLILFVLVTYVFGWPFPLTTTQILWINLVTNGLPALALSMEPPERDIMRRRPRSPREPVITLRHGLQICGQGALVTLVTMAGYALVYQGLEGNLPRARTMAFCVISYSFVFFSLGCRSQRYTMPELGLFSNPYLFGAIALSCLLQLSVVTLPFAQPYFESAQHFMWEWVLLVVLVLTPVSVIELCKLWKRQQVPRPG